MEGQQPDISYRIVTQADNAGLREHTAAVQADAAAVKEQAAALQASAAAEREYFMVRDASGRFVRRATITDTTVPQASRAAPTMSEADLARAQLDAERRAAETAAASVATSRSFGAAAAAPFAITTQAELRSAEALRERLSALLVSKRLLGVQDEQLVAKVALLDAALSTESAGLVIEARASMESAAAKAALAAASGEAAAAAGAEAGAHGANTIAMRESTVIARELSTGNISRMPGSISLLAQQFGGLGASMGSMLAILGGFVAFEAVSKVLRSSAEEAKKLREEIDKTVEVSAALPGVVSKYAYLRQTLSEADLQSQNLSLHLQEAARSNDALRDSVSELESDTQRLAAANDQAAAARLRHLQDELALVQAIRGVAQGDADRIKTALELQAKQAELERQTAADRARVGELQKGLAGALTQQPAAKAQADASQAAADQSKAESEAAKKNYDNALARLKELGLYAPPGEKLGENVVANLQTLVEKQRSELLPAVSPSMPEDYVRQLDDTIKNASSAIGAIAKQVVPQFGTGRPGEVEFASRLQEQMNAGRVSPQLGGVDQKLLFAYAQSASALDHDREDVSKLVPAREPLRLAMVAAEKAQADADAKLAADTAVLNNLTEARKKYADDLRKASEALYGNFETGAAGALQARQQQVEGMWRDFATEQTTARLKAGAKPEDIYKAGAEAAADAVRLQQQFGPGAQIAERGQAAQLAQQNLLPGQALSEDQALAIQNLKRLESDRKSIEALRELGVSLGMNTEEMLGTLRDIAAGQAVQTSRVEEDRRNINEINTRLAQLEQGFGRVGPPSAASPFATPAPVSGPATQPKESPAAKAAAAETFPAFGTPHPEQFRTHADFLRALQLYEEAVAEERAATRATMAQMVRLVRSNVDAIRQLQVQISHAS